METLYEHAGGDDGLHRLEELFYAKALADPVLKTLFTTRVPTHVDHLTWFTAESFGGPDRFSRELGFRTSLMCTGTWTSPTSSGTGSCLYGGPRRTGPAARR